MLQSEVACMLFRDELGVGGYLDRKIVTGPLQTLVDETELFLQKSMTIGARIEGWKRIDLPENPLEALREAVVNAVVHRDYSRDGVSIRVFFLLKGKHHSTSCASTEANYLVGSLRNRHC